MHFPSNVEKKTIWGQNLRNLWCYFNQVSPVLNFVVLTQLWNKKMDASNFLTCIWSVITPVYLTAKSCAEEAHWCLQCFEYDSVQSYCFQVAVHIWDNHTTHSLKKQRPVVKGRITTKVTPSKNIFCCHQRHWRYWTQGHSILSSWTATGQASLSFYDCLLVQYFVTMVRKTEGRSQKWRSYWLIAWPLKSRKIIPQISVWVKGTNQFSCKNHDGLIATPKLARQLLSQFYRNVGVH